MKTLNQFDYYSKRIVNLMGELEYITQDSIAETDPFLECLFWRAVDEKDIGIIKYINSYLCERIDKLTMANVIPTREELKQDYI
jgi:hypothetical protein